MTTRPHRPYVRSRLYVPGTKTSWLDKAAAAGADAVILDLEDSVAESDKRQAREAVAATVREDRTGPLLFVRVNELGSALALDDLEAVVRPGLFGVVVPKVSTPREIAALDLVLSWLEARQEMEPGSVCVSPVIETALAVHDAFSVAAASGRVDYTGGIASHGGDIEQAIGYRWSRSGTESAALRAQVLIAVRAAGVSNPMTGIWTVLDDPDGISGFAAEGASLGYTGMDVVHPDHVATVNAAFAPGEDRLNEARAILAADSEGAAVRHGGRMVDRAMVRTAGALLREIGEIE
jgi:citrate lyase subunit beta/citryl-CoA lyase